MPVNETTVKGILKPLLTQAFLDAYSDQTFDKDVTLPTMEMNKMINIITNSVAGTISIVLSTALVNGGVCPPGGGPIAGGLIVLP